MVSPSNHVCYGVHSKDRSVPLLVLSLPSEVCDFDELLPEVLRIIETNATTRKSDGGCILDYELLLFCAGTCRPSWPWLIHNFTKLNKKYKKGLQKLYLVHEKSWIRVCMQLLENFVSPKFAKKISHIRNLTQLHEELGTAMQSITIPDAAKEHDKVLIEQDLQTRKRRRQESKCEHEQSSRSVSASTDPVVTVKTAPPAVPPSRSLARTASTHRKNIAQPPPVLPPRRSTISRTISEGRGSSESLVIFEDPDDEAAAHRATCSIQDLLTRELTGSSSAKHIQANETGQRSSSAPSVVQPHTPRHPESLKSAYTKPKPADTLRRAISGPLTPSSSLKQNYLPPINKDLSPPKLMIRGKQVTVKLRKSQPGEEHGKVGGLKALFEQKALVAQQLS